MPCTFEICANFYGDSLRNYINSNDPQNKINFEHIDTRIEFFSLRNIWVIFKVCMTLLMKLGSLSSALHIWHVESI